MSTRRSRLDRELVRRGLAASRTEAQRLVAQGRVTVRGAPALKASTMVALDDPLLVRDDDPGWASRGAHKLVGALEAFAVRPAGRHVLDAGAAHGGFTDVVLRAGAARVVAVDVGYGQLPWRLRSDERVVVRDRTNVRHLVPADVGSPVPDLVVADLSFISLRLVLPALREVSDPAADFVLLVKPQFEAGPERVGSGGVVRDPQVWHDALTGVVTAAADMGLGLAGAAVSPLPGPAGNIEFFVHLRADASIDVDRALAAAVQDGRVLAAAPLQ